METADFSQPQAPLSPSSWRQAKGQEQGFPSAHAKQEASKHSAAHVHRPKATWKATALAKCEDHSTSSTSMQRGVTGPGFS